MNDDLLAWMMFILIIIGIISICILTFFGIVKFIDSPISECEIKVVRVETAP